MSQYRVGHGKVDSYPAIVVTLILYIVGTWAGLSASWVQEHILGDVFSQVAILVILAGSILVCLIPERGLVSKFVLAFAAGLFQGLLVTLVQQDRLVPLFLGVSIILIAFLVSLRRHIPTRVSSIPLQGIPRIILAGVLSNLIFAGLAVLTFFLGIAYHTSSTIMLDIGILCLGFPVAGFVLGAVAARLAGRGPGGFVAALISGIGWFIYILVGNVVGGTGIDRVGSFIFLFVVVVIMPLIGARAAGSKMSQ